MTETNVVMEDFMKKLENDEFKKVIIPNDGPELTTEFIEEQVRSFTELLETGLVDAATSYLGR